MGPTGLSQQRWSFSLAETVSQEDSGYERFCMKVQGGKQWEEKPVKLLRSL